MVDLSDAMKDELIEALSQNTTDSVYLKDAKSGRFVWTNDAKAAKYGKKPEEMIGLTDFDLLPEEEAKNAWKSDQQAIESRSCVKGEESLTRRDGSVGWVSFTKCPRIVNGEVVRVMGISRNITEQKITENHNVAVTYLLKHDVINKLMAMTLIVTFLLKNKYTNPQIALRNLKKKIVSTEKRVRDCVLMDENASKVKTIDISDLVDSVLDEYSEDFIEKNITIDNNLGGIPQDKAKVEASEELISSTKNALRNFSDNSVKHAGEGITVAVGCEDMEEATKIIFYNSGIIQKEVVERLFEPGQTDGKGTGMGLYLTRESIRNLGGDIWYEPSWEGHTQFIILIPKIKKT
jgi:PAS domain S-box-containing protein